MDDINKKFIELKIDDLYIKVGNNKDDLEKAIYYLELLKNWFDGNKIKELREE